MINSLNPLEFKSSLPWMQFPAMPDQASAMALAMQYQLEQTQWLTPEQLFTKQMQQLQPLLLHAMRHSPYYHGKIPSRLTGKILSPEEFRQLPVLKREDARDHCQALHSIRVPAAHRQVSTTTTSGSTGTPVTIHLSAINAYLWRSFALRDHLWHQRNLQGTLCSIRWVDHDTAGYPHGLESTDWGKITSTSFHTGRSFLLSVRSTVDEQLEWLDRKNPDYILSFPSNLTALAERSLTKNIRFNNLKEVRTIGETLREETRQLVKQAWGVNIADIYTCEETGYLALQCPEHAHYHVQSENVIVEIVNDNNEPCQPGEEGRVLITALHNYCTPLIRYELGDRAIPGAPCPCGRGLPTISRISGRQRNRLLRPDGTRQFPYLGEHGQVLAITGVQPRQTQFIQTSAGQIEITYALDEAFTQQQEKELDRLYQGIFGPGFRFTYRYVETIPKGASGKFEDFICQC